VEVLENVDEEFVRRLLPELMERTGLIYGVAEYKHDVRR